MTEGTNETPISGRLIEALRLGSALAVEVPASTPERLAGVTIFPQRGAQDQQARAEGWKASIPDRQFTVTWREYSRPHLKHDWDIVHGDGIWELKRTQVAGEQALIHLLQEWNVSLAVLTYLWNSTIPE